MDLNTLTTAGLTPEEAKIYNLLATEGELTAGEIIQKTALKRGDCYNKLYSLENKKLIEEVYKHKKKHFRLENPELLEKMFDLKVRTIEEAKKNFHLELPEIVSHYNLFQNKPGVVFFEGLEGIKRVLNDTLINNPSKKLLTFSDVAGYAAYLKKWNTSYYAPERKKREIFEKVIIPNNPLALEYMRGYKSNEVTDILFIDHQLYPFKTEINIYDEKVSFVTFSPKGHIGVIVENKEIYETLKSTFNFTWDLGKRYCQDLQPEWLKDHLTQNI